MARRPLRTSDWGQVTAWQPRVPASMHAQAARVGVGLMPCYRRSPMALEVAEQAAGENGGASTCTVQLLSLGDTFAAVSRLADQTKPETSPSDRGREVRAWHAAGAWGMASSASAR